VSELTPPVSESTISLPNNLTLVITPQTYLVCDQNGVTTSFGRNQDANVWLEKDVTALTTVIDAEAGHQQRRVALLDFLSTQLTQTEGE